MPHHRHPVTEDPLKVAGMVAIAAAVGAGVALLLTPRSGKQVRGGLKRRADHLKDNLQDHLVRTIDDADDTVDEAKERLQATATKVAGDAKSTARKVSNDTKAVKTRAKTTTKVAAKPRKRSS